MKAPIFLSLLTPSQCLKRSKSLWETIFVCLVVMSISSVFLIDAYADKTAVSSKLIQPLN